MYEQEEQLPEIELFEAQNRRLPTLKSGELLLGKISNISDTGWPIVEFPNIEGCFQAITTVDVNSSHIGKQVATMLTAQDPQQVVVIGLIRSPLDQILEARESQSISENTGGAEAIVDGKKLHIEGKEEIVLKCGESSIVLTKAGKILIRGKYLLNRSSGVNRIMGGSVQVN